MEKDFRFNIEEAAGAVGDFGTLIPIIFGVAAVTKINIAPVLFFFGISYILTGIYYKLPMPVEPMKAIGAIAISGALTAGEIAGAGIMTGIIFLIVALTDGMKFIKRYVPHWLIRGIQFGLALTLSKTALNFIADDLLIGLISAFIIILFYFLPISDISSLIVFVLGLGVGIYNYGFPETTAFNLPVLTLPAGVELWSGFIKGTLAQLPLTLGNAVLATSLLIKDLLDRNVSERKIVGSIGLMSLISSAFGGFPMCHGAGGLAAQYRFGARTGGSNIISGVIILTAAFFFASQELVNIIPFGVLGALLVFSALQLLNSAVKTESKLYTGITGIIAFFAGMTAAFLIMMTFSLIKKFLISRG
ncbi:MULTISPECIES: putative sulfate/molybdate transporter [unclassified Halanaerobium]|uniref:putative sulfate/molybdate transporter n=1 Tax=unclassified Halanaerobium TaxID=2641197 RepID=UPI000DF28449|nr:MULTISPECIES: putative sulfate/molybdate transporter [unclassified Halanaerobium]RCW47731.1 MFS superfamily molybdate transporter [Halanaerobium sp. MA284_MarDTE_T2]RCW87982.1 MFS superfamily molybdate transporter [Halanaerobium sp. DL-01]